jgi:hypothetical protein
MFIWHGRISDCAPFEKSTIEKKQGLLLDSYCQEITVEFDNLYEKLPKIITGNIVHRRHYSSWHCSSCMKRGIKERDFLQL